MLRRVKWRGDARKEPGVQTLRAGPLTLQFSHGDVRHIRWGGHELVQRVYFALRDQHWDTIPAQLSRLRVTRGARAFRIAYTATHRRGGVAFRWNAVITGTAAGEIRFEADGAAQSEFLRNRIGLCVLHPLEGAGAACAVTHSDGTTERGALPAQIAPHQPFIDMVAIRQRVAPGVWVRVGMHGDVFETEDQRNWSDASFKTYSTPLALPMPVRVRPGDRVRQAISVSLELAAGKRKATRAPRADAAVICAPERGPAQPLPAIGLGRASHGQPLTAREADLIRGLHPAHLRAEVPLAGAVEALVRQAAGEAQLLDVPLELAAMVPGDDAGAALARLRDALLAVRPRLARVLALPPGGGVTPAGLAELARRVLGDAVEGAALGGGTSAYFTDLNRNRPDARAWDVVCYSVNPQVHAFDDASLIENTATLAQQVRSARAYCGPAAIAVSPLTLRPRRGPAGAAGGTALPRDVDPRQLSLFGAAWITGCLKYLTAGGAASVTCLETTGWRGVMEVAAGSPNPAEFPSLPGGVFPLYHALADVQEFATGSGVMLPLATSDRLRVDGLCLMDGARRRVLLANVTGEPQRVQLALGARVAGMRMLDAAAYQAGALHPQQFRARSVVVRARSGALTVELPAYASACITADIAP